MLNRWYREISNTAQALCLSRSSRARESCAQSYRADEKDANHSTGLEHEEDLSDGEAMMDQDSETGTMLLVILRYSDNLGQTFLRRTRLIWTSWTPGRKTTTSTRWGTSSVYRAGVKSLQPLCKLAFRFRQSRVWFSASNCEILR